MTEIKSHQINVFVLGRNQRAIPGAKVVAYDGEEGVGGAIMGGSALAPARITLSEEYESVKLVATVEGHGSKEATVNADVGNYYFEFEDVVAPDQPGPSSLATPPADPAPTGGGMSTNLLVVLGRIAGLAGVSAGILFLLFQRILVEKLITNASVSGDQAYHIIIALMILTFGFAAIGVVAWLIGRSSDPSKPISRTGLAVLGILALAVLFATGFSFSQGVGSAKATPATQPQPNQTPPQVAKTPADPSQAEDQKKPTRIISQKTGDIYVDRVLEKIAKGEADPNWSEAERASALEGLFERGAFSCASTESWPEMFWAVSATRLVLQDNVPAFKQHPDSRNALNKASGILLRMEHDIAPLWGDSFDPTAALHTYAGNHDAFIRHLPAMVARPDSALESKRKQNVSALRSALKGVVPLADDDQCQFATVGVPPPVDPQGASLTLEFDSLKERFSAVNQSLMQRGSDLGALPLKPDITAALGTARDDLATIEQALQNRDWNVATQRMQRVKKTLSYLESL